MENGKFSWLLIWQWILITLRETKEKINKWDFIKIKMCAAKDNINKFKSDSTTKRQAVQYKIWQRTWMDTSLKMIYKYSITGKILSILNHWSEIEVTQSCPILCYPMDMRLLHPWDFPGKSTVMGCLFLLQGTSRPRDRTQVSRVVDRCFAIWAGECKCKWQWDTTSYTLN